jgi:hypothetical protein
MAAVIFWTSAAGTDELVYFDVYSEETHEYPCEVTEFPVELAPGMTDQIILKPKGLTLVGYVGDRPLTHNAPGLYSKTQTTVTGPSVPTYVQASQELDVPPSPLVYNAASLLTAGFNALVGGSPVVQIRKPQGTHKDSLSVTSWSAPDWQSRVQATKDLLTQAREDRVQLRVFTDYDDTSGYVIESLQFALSAETGLGADFTLQLRTITIAESQVVAVPKPALLASKPKRPVGAKSTVEAPKKTDEELRSQLYALTFGSSGWFGYQAPE